jgi:hypothetical protein
MWVRGARWRALAFSFAIAPRLARVVAGTIPQCLSTLGKSSPGKPTHLIAIL